MATQNLRWQHQQQQQQQQSQPSVTRLAVSLQPLFFWEQTLSGYHLERLCYRARLSRRTLCYPAHHLRSLPLIQRPKNTNVNKGSTLCTQPQPARLGVTEWDADKVRKVKIIDVNGPTPLPELPIVVHVVPVPKAVSMPAVKEGDMLDVLCEYCRSLVECTLMGHWYSILWLSYTLFVPVFLTFLFLRTIYIVT